MLASEPAHPVIEPMLIAQSFYRMANALSLARGLDPDRPPHLRQGDRDGLMPIALHNGRVLRGQALVEGQCVLLEGGRILDIVPANHPRCRGASQRRPARPAAAARDSSMCR